MVEPKKWNNQSGHRTHCISSCKRRKSCGHPLNFKLILLPMADSKLPLPAFSRLNVSLLRKNWEKIHPLKEAETAMSNLKEGYSRCRRTGNSLEHGPEEWCSIQESNRYIYISKTVKGEEKNMWVVFRSRTPIVMHSESATCFLYRSLAIPGVHSQQIQSWAVRRF